MHRRCELFGHEVPCAAGAKLLRARVVRGFFVWRVVEELESVAPKVQAIRVRRTLPRKAGQNSLGRATKSLNRILEKVFGSGFFSFFVLP